MPYEEAQALLGQGRCLVALGKAPEAAAPLAAAREIFARLGAKPALAETDEWLDAGDAGMTDTVRCPSCDAENPSGFKFCGQCAAPLSHVAPISEERKVVTTLFCDLVGFTAMSETSRPEDIDALLARYHEAARKVIESHGGAVEKFIGDAVVGVFGVPAVHEDDAERAVRAGLRILEALDGMDDGPTARRSRRAAASTPARHWCGSTSTPPPAAASSPGTRSTPLRACRPPAPPGGVVVGGPHPRTSRPASSTTSRAPPVVAEGQEQPVAAWRATGRRLAHGSRRTLVCAGPCSAAMRTAPAWPPPSPAPALGLGALPPAGRASPASARVASCRELSGLVTRALGCPPGG